MSAVQNMISSALVATDRAPRYGKQLIAHLGRHLEASWDEDTASGVVRFEHGHCELTSSENGLLMQLMSSADAPATAEQLDRMEDVIGRHLVRFGARDELVAAWMRADGTPGSTQRVDSDDEAVTSSS